MIVRSDLMVTAFIVIRKKHLTAIFPRSMVMLVKEMYFATSIGWQPQSRSDLKFFCGMQAYSCSDFPVSEE